MASRIAAALAVLLANAAAALGASVHSAQHSISSTSPKPPTFPDRFTVKFNVSMPHFYLTQPQGLTYQVIVYYDRASNRKRVDVYNGLDTTLDVGGEEYTLHPRIDKYACDKFTIGPIKQSGRSLLYSPSNDELDPFWPDMSTWDYGGQAALPDGRTAYIWNKQEREGGEGFDKTSQYIFYTDAKTGAPIKLHMLGLNALTGSHFDEYVYEFLEFEDVIYHIEETFQVPQLCQDASATRVRGHRSSQAVQAHALLPNFRTGWTHEHSYNAWARLHTRTHEHQEEYEGRLERFKQVATLVSSHNANPENSYKLELNRFADWSDDEYVGLMLPNRKTREERKALRASLSKGKYYQPLGVFNRTMKAHDLPKEVDWRGTGVDPGVKDQGMCGSCFAFSTTSTMEGSWYVQTGQRRSFAEQQIIDCAWDYGPNGCGGGDYQPAMWYVKEAGGIALNQEYTYDGVNNFCRAKKHELVGRFKGFLDIPSRDELALMEAVYRLGPIAVPVDAGPDNFRFYAEGVFHDPSCHIKSEDLDHAVVLYGYGTTESGIDYWLVRNSWSKFYGDDGYIKMMRGKKDCGISTEAIVAVVDDASVVPGHAELAAKEAVVKGPDGKKCDRKKHHMMGGMMEEATQAPASRKLLSA